ncbi:MAG: hypothetical protein KBS72_07395 [Bacteroidales bacterium]|nr:hypothetical protein [Candidatus Cacconaster scatequi]
MLFKNDGYPLVKMEDGHRMVLRVAESKHILNAHGKLNSFHRRKYREKSTFEAEIIATGMQIFEKKVCFDAKSFRPAISIREKLLYLISVVFALEDRIQL